MAYSIQVECQGCGKSFAAKRKDTPRCQVCSVAARRLSIQRYQKERRAREPKPSPKNCVDCGSLLAGKRQDAERCDECKPKRKVVLSQRRDRRMPSIPRMCILCKESFESPRQNRVRCPACLAGRAAREPKAIVTCIECGAEFKAKNTLARRCPSCRDQRRDAYNKEYEHGKRKGACIDCGAEIGKRALRCHPCDNKARSEYMRGERVANWKGGRSLQKGYVFVRVKDEAGGPGVGALYRGEHILNWERANQKPLPKGWVVHHLNGVKDDNRIENLAAMPRHNHHSHPRDALKSYERRILQLETELRELQQLKMGLT